MIATGPVQSYAIEFQKNEIYFLIEQNMVKLLIILDLHLIY